MEKDREHVKGVNRGKSGCVKGWRGCFDKACERRFVFGNAKVERIRKIFPPQGFRSRWQGRVLGLLLPLFLLPATAFSQDSGDQSLSIGWMTHRVEFKKESYNEYIERISDQDAGNFAGYRLEYAFFPQTIGEGRSQLFLEHFNLEYRFDFKDANGQTKTNEMGFKTLGLGIVIKSELSSHFGYGLNASVGVLNLTRNFHRQKASSVRSDGTVDVEENKTKVEDNGNLYTTVGVHLFYRFNPNFSADVGLGLLNSKVPIGSANTMPGLNEKGEAEGMTLDLTSWGYKAGITVSF